MVSCSAKARGQLGNLASYRSIVARDIPRSMVRRGRVPLEVDMMIDRNYLRSGSGQLKNGPQGRGKPFWAILLLVPILCQCSQGPPPAPASSFEFNDQQAAATLATLRDLAMQSPDESEVSLELLPSDGVRWETLEAAVSHAVEVPELQMAVVSTRSVSDTREVLYLQDANSWPAVVTVVRTNEPPYVSVEAVMGPWPDQPASRALARQIERRVLDSIIQYGKIRRVPDYQQTFTFE